MKQKKNGFTIIELVIALFVLTVAVIGVYNAFSIMVVTTAQMSDRFTAAYLAQEGIEIIRNMRDNNWLQGKPDWLDGLSGCESGCQIDFMAGQTLTSYSDSGYLNIDSNGFYFYSAINPAPTKFKRKITITPNGDHILKIAVAVFWEEKPTIVNIDFPVKPGSITAEDYLYNWY